MKITVTYCSIYWNISAFKTKYVNKIISVEIDLEIMDTWIVFIEKQVFSCLWILLLLLILHAVSIQKKTFSLNS